MLLLKITFFAVRDQGQRGLQQEFKACQIPVELSNIAELTAFMFTQNTIPLP